MSQTPRESRRFDLDWLRVLAVLLLIPFHSALVFNLDPNSIVYLKDAVHSPVLSAAAGFVHVWHMPLLFFIAGASTWFALGFRTAGKYANERLLRLLVPFLFGLVVFIPPMTYIHYLGRANLPTFGQHLARFFTDFADLTGVRGGFTPAHLWFIMFLFVFSLAGLPVFLALRGDRGRRFIAWLGGWVGQAGVLFLLVVPLALAAAPDILGDKNPLYYFAVFMAGYLLTADERIQKAIERQAFVALALGVAAYVALQWLRAYRFAPWSPAWVGTELTWQLARWTWLLAWLGLGRRFLNFANRALRYLSEACYPVYILHLPILTLVAWLVIRLQANVAVKYSLIVGLTVAAAFALYEIAGRLGVLRFLFGMKRKIS